MARMLLLLLLQLAASGCGDRDARPERAAPERGTRMASVNGEPIASDEVAALCRASGLSGKQALQRLVAMRLLAQHARTLGYDRHAEVERGVAQASVQALLASAVERGSATTEIAARQRRLEVLLAELSGRTQVKYEEEAIAKLFAGAPP